MHCSSCQADNKDADTRCVSCGGELKPAKSSTRSRGRRKDPQGPLSPETEADNRAALRAYRVSIYSLIPGLGLVLGPMAAILGAVARLRCVRNPDFTLWGPLLASIIIGAVVTLCNAVGFTLMYFGLRSAGVL
jgi:hypothetical protein